MSFDKVKAAVVICFTALSSWMGVLAIPMYILIGLNILDYGTGVYAARFRGEQVNSYKGINGIAKKIGMWIMVVLGAIVDLLLMYATDVIGLEVPFAFLVASLVAIWLICNEIISIIENVADFGVEAPPFLQPIINMVKRFAEEKVNIGKKGDTK